MAVIFGKAVVAAATKRAVLADVFERDVEVYDETEGDAPERPNQFRVITNYRGHTKANKGRKAALMGQTVLDLSPIGQAIPLNELRDTIARLTKLADEVEAEGVLGGKGDPTLLDAALNG